MLRTFASSIVHLDGFLPVPKNVDAASSTADFARASRLAELVHRECSGGEASKKASGNPLPPVERQLPLLHSQRNRLIFPIDTDVSYNFGKFRKGQKLFPRQTAILMAWGVLVFWRQ